MTEILIAGAVIALVVLIAIVIYLVESYRGCWHKWGSWAEDSTNDAYCQRRSCAKCGYTEREQFRKLKE